MPSTTRSQHQRPDWGKRVSGFAALLAASAAVGGLIVTTWSTYHGDATQKDQSHQQSANEAKQQASEFDMWEQRTDSGVSGYIVLANRSADPIYQVTLDASYSVVIGNATHELDGMTYIITVAPCTRVQISVSALMSSVDTRDLVHNGPHPKGMPYPPLSYEGLIGVHFVDVNGVLWRRALYGPLTKEGTNDWYDIPKLRADAGLKPAWGFVDPELPAEGAGLTFSSAQSCS